MGDFKAICTKERRVFLAEKGKGLEMENAFGDPFLESQWHKI